MQGRGAWTRKVAATEESAQNVRDAMTAARPSVDSVRSRGARESLF